MSEPKNKQNQLNERYMENNWAESEPGKKSKCPALHTIQRRGKFDSDIGSAQKWLRKLERVSVPGNYEGTVRCMYSERKRKVGTVSVPVPTLLNLCTVRYLPGTLQRWKGMSEWGTFVHKMKGKRVWVLSTEKCAGNVGSMQSWCRISLVLMLPFRKEKKNNSWDPQTQHVPICLPYLRYWAR